MLQQQIVNGLMLGSVYALIGVGYTLVFGVLRMLNLAHAYLFMIAPFIALFAIKSGIAPSLAVIVGLGASALLGILLYQVAFRPIPPKHALGGFVTSLSFGVVLQVIVVNSYGTLKIPFGTGLALPDVEWDGLILSGVQALSLVLATALMLGLLVVIKRTRFGRNIRALAQNETAALLLGVAARKHVRLTFFVSSALAGLAGIMVAERFGTVSAYMGDTYAIKALAVIVIGGLGDLRGAMIAGLLLGVFEVLFQAYAPPGWSEAFVWLLLIATFLFKPEGIFGMRISRREI
ncbi:MAG: branched-chain amino acid ABC transporter permease [Burkholderiaceae bacterium]|nr:branched-chain amino acid ABC transporter permease [Burkholderiaceae bacterium]